MMTRLEAFQRLADHDEDARAKPERAQHWRTVACFAVGFVVGVVLSWGAM